MMGRLNELVYECSKSLFAIYPVGLSITFKTKSEFRPKNKVKNVKIAKMENSRVFKSIYQVYDGHGISLWLFWIESYVSRRS